MKKFSVLLTLAVLMVSSSVFAGSIDYLSNQSAKFLMTFHRNASTDASADIVNYNPAGTAFLAEGFYIDVSNQTLFKPYEQKSTVDITATATAYTSVADKTATLEQDQPTYLLPNVYVAYNFGQMGPGKLAAYGQVGITAGGGTLKWDDGTAGTTVALSAIGVNTFMVPFTGAGGVAAMPGSGTFAAARNSGNLLTQSFEGSSQYYGFAAGAAYSFADMASLSLGGRYIISQKTLKLEATYSQGTTLTGEYSYDAKGYTPIIGIDVKPIADLTIAARYEFETKLEYKYKEEELTTGGADALRAGVLKAVAQGVLTNTGITDGAKSKYNLPAILALGAEYAVTPELAVMASSNIYFLGQSDMGDVKDAADGSVVKKLNKYYGTGWEAGLGVTYKVMQELKVGAGFIYTESGAKKEYFENQYTLLNCSGNPPLDSYTIGLGATYTVIPNLDVTLAGSWTHYIPVDYDIAVQGASAAAVSTVSGEYKKDVYNIGLGVGYKI